MIEYTVYHNVHNANCRLTMACFVLFAFLFRQEHLNSLLFSVVRYNDEDTLCPNKGSRQIMK